jgi:glucose/arabinose dehydrogenase
MKTFVNTALLLVLVSATARAQINAGEQKPEPSLPFTMTEVAQFKLPWRIAFLPDGRMLVTEKVGPVWLVTQKGEKTPVDNVPAVLYQGQGGMLGVFLSPHYATDHSVYLTYAEPGEDPGTSGLALARAKLAMTATAASLEGLEVLWRDMPKGRGGQFGAQIAFSPDNRFLFLTVGDRQRMTPAQDRTRRWQGPSADPRRQARAGQSDGRQDRRDEPAPDQSAARHRTGQDGARHQHVYDSRTECRAFGNVGERRADAVWPGVRARRPPVGSGARSPRR